MFGKKIFRRKKQRWGMIKKAWNILCFLTVMIVYISYITFGCVVIFLLRLVVRGEKAENFLVRITKVSWLHLTRAMFCGYFPGRVFIRYDPRILEKDKNIVISNHLTEYDWLFVSSVMDYFKRFEDICIILKMSLKNIPLLGYGMTFFQFIFLNRKISKDIELIKSGISRLKKKGKYDLLLFPEGTYIDKDSHPKSQKWSSQAKVDVRGKRFNPEEVIIPRTTGFKILIENIGDHMDGIVDITMIGNPHVKYPNDVFSYWDVIVNKSCKVNFMFFIDYIPKGDKISPNQFILETFERKERMISKCKELKREGVVNSMAEFQRVADELVKPDMTYQDTAIDLTTPWGPFFHITFIFSSALIINSFVRLLFK